MKLLKWLDRHGEEALLVILLVVIACVSMAQVVIRKMPWIPALTWAEEFCRFCWIWSVFLSLPYTLRMSSMLRVTVLLDVIPEKLMKMINIGSYVVTTVVMAVLAYYSIGVIGSIKASNELSPAMLWPMWQVYSVMFVGFALATFRGAQQVYHHVKHIHEKELNTAEQAMAEAKAETKLAREGM